MFEILGGSAFSEDEEASFSVFPPSPPAACPHWRHLGDAVSVSAKVKISKLNSDSNSVPGYYCMDRRLSKITTPVASLGMRGAKQVIGRTVQGLVTIMSACGTVSGN